MAGLLNARPAPGGANQMRVQPANNASPQGGGDASLQDGDVGGEAPNVSPEEQQQYDQFVNNALELIYPQGSNGDVAPVILQHLSGQFGQDEAQMLAQADPPVSNNPTDNLAATAVLVVIMVEASAANAKAQIDDAVLYHAGLAIIEELAEVAQAASIHDYGDKEMEASFYRALDIYRVTSPRADQNTLSQEFGEIEQADKSGNLGQLIPGIDSAMKRSA